MHTIVHWRFLIKLLVPRMYMYMYFTCMYMYM